MDKDKLIKNLKQNNYEVSFFDSSEEASAYLDKKIDEYSVGIGDSLSIKEIGLIPLLEKHNTVYLTDHTKGEKVFLESAKKTFFTDIFLTSANAVSETGEIINIDGTGNRVGSSLFGHKKVYFIFGTNKVEPDLSQAIYRARNTAAPLNAKRLKKNTPCTKLNRCADCYSPDRICNALTIYYKKMSHVEAEVIIIDKKLGF